MLRVTIAVLSVFVMFDTRSGEAAPSEENASWLAGLTDRVIADLAAGKPLVVDVNVPLCDNAITACGNAKLGDPDTPETNLYWATTPGFGRWFDRRASGWKRVLQTTKDTGDKDVLDLRAYRRTVVASAAWRKRGVPKRFDMVVVIRAWRGSAIDRALAVYASDISESTARTVTLNDKTEISAGGTAQIVAFVGHNRLMDLDTFKWPSPGKDTKGTIAIACHTRSYMKEVPAKTRVPLLMTRDYLFSNAAPLEAAVLAFAAGEGYQQIRTDAATAYAGVQKKEVRRVIGAFTNPADRRW
jgi:hypothetical protein